MTDERWVRLCSVADVPLREGRAITVADREIALFNLGNRFLAVASRCPHEQGPLADGIVTGHSVVCPLHAWKISLETGCVDRPSGQESCVERYDLRVEDGIVAIAWPPRRRDARDGQAA